MENGKLTEKLIEVQNEVKEMNSLIIQASSTNEKLKEVYKGCQLFLSPIYYNPEFLYIGINPGAGYYNKHKELLQRFDPMSKHDFENQPFKTVKSCFKMIKKENVLESMVVINNYPYSTKDTTNLEKLFELVPPPMQPDVINKADKWVKTIIQEISPKYILCGGIRAYGGIKSIYPESYKSLEYSKCTHIGTIGDVIVIGYKRNRWGTMSNKKDLIKYLEKYIK
jgi:hypothetical protein